jgi:hypothetical protein
MITVTITIDGKNKESIVLKNIGKLAGLRYPSDYRIYTINDSEIKIGHSLKDGYMELVRKVITKLCLERKHKR